MLEQIGLLDEGLYTYFDDIDICLRARRAGWEVWYVPESKIIHLEGASTGIKGSTPEQPKRRPTYWFQARRRFFLKNHGKLYTALADAAFLGGYAIWRLRRLLQRKPDLDPKDFLADSFRNSVFRTGLRVTRGGKSGSGRPLPRPDQDRLSRGGRRRPHDDGASPAAIGPRKSTTRLRLPETLPSQYRNTPTAPGILPTTTKKAKARASAGLQPLPRRQ